jgi:uncharacterized membrane protein
VDLISRTRLRLWWERAFWVIPLAGVLAGFVVGQGILAFDEANLIRERGPVSTEAATAILAAIGGGMVTFTGFVFSFVVLILQFGSSQYSPRTVTYFLRARSTQWILAVFLATITVTFLGLIDIGSGPNRDFTSAATVLLSALLLLASLVGFILLLHSIGRRVRVDAVVADIGRHARMRLTNRVTVVDPAWAIVEDSAAADPSQAAYAHYQHRNGKLVAIDAPRLLSVARRHSVSIELTVRVGDSVTHGARVARIEPFSDSVERAVCRSLVVDVERSMSTDPLYALRILVDIALKALSPAVNDPTTAVRALDEIEGVLRAAGPLPLGSFTASSGVGAVVIPGPTWADIVDLALVEILLSGRHQPQVTRRVLSLVDDLLPDLAERRRPALERHRRSIEARAAALGEDPALFLVADHQGIGGSGAS